MIPDCARIDPIGPSPDVIELTKRILEQNRMILEMNADLLAVLSNPRLIIQTKEAKP